MLAPGVKAACVCSEAAPCVDAISSTYCPLRPIAMLPRPLSFFVPLKLNDCASLFILCTVAKATKPRANSANHAYLKLKDCASIFSFRALNTSLRSRAPLEEHAYLKFHRAPLFSSKLQIN